MHPLIREQCYINGKWLEASDQTRIAVYNPFDQTLLGHVPNLSKPEILQAIECAHHAWLPWKNRTAHDRQFFLMRWYQLILENKSELAKLITLEQGKPISEALTEIDYGASFVQWFSEEGKRAYGDIIPSTQPDQRFLVIKQAIGPSAAITPWNFPVAMITRKCAPALAAGCPVVIKPSSLTPFSALAMACLAEQAGFPKGIFNVVTGDASMIADVFCTNPLIKKISFTGSTEVGKKLAEKAGKSLKKLSLELGGNAPFILFEDADLPTALNALKTAKFRNTGQTCIGANRFFVHHSRYSEFVSALQAYLPTLKMGNGLEEDTQLATLINESAIEKIEYLINDAMELGAKCLMGGKRLDSKGYFFEPTILSEITAKMKIAQEEIFGPIIAIQTFSNENDLIQTVNDTPYGLAAYYFTQNIQRVIKTAEQLECGIMGINAGAISNAVTPFGGIKASGYGREGSKYGLDEYLETKYLCVGGLDS